MINETQEDDRFVTDEEYENEILVTYLWDIFWDLPLKKYSLNPVKLKSNNILNFKIDKLLAGQKWPKSFEVTKILSD